MSRKQVLIKKKSTETSKCKRGKLEDQNRTTQTCEAKIEQL
jgi:hypothetical protein